jgi:ribosomal protein L30E
MIKDYKNNLTLKLLPMMKERREFFGCAELRKSLEKREFNIVVINETTEREREKEIAHFDSISSAPKCR